MNASDLYRRLANDCGALAIACLKAEDFADASTLEARFTAWEQAGNQGLFAYLERKHDILCHPFATRPWAHSLLCLAFLPRPWQDNPLYSLPAPQPGRPVGRIAAYYLNEDYHRTGQIILDKLNQTLRASFSGASETFGWEPCVDSGAVWEKVCCVMGGLGNSGLNSLLRSDDFGSRCHLAAVCTSLDLPRRILTAPPSSCLDCQRCLRACPGGALQLDRQPDYRRCCSYLSGEKSGPLTWNEQLLLGGRLLGCSCCTMVCPAAKLPPPPPDLLVDAENILRLPTAELSRMLKGTAAEHPGPIKLKRNAAAALGAQWPQETRQARRQELMSLSASEAIIQTIANWPV